MKRAMRCFELQGLKPVAYPVDFLSGGEYRWTDSLPSVDNLWKLGTVFREYLALGWYWIIAADEKEKGEMGRRPDLEQSDDFIDAIYR